MKHIKLLLMLCIVALAYNCKTEKENKDLAYAVEF
ncbi:MAG: zinc protease, partial [Psychroserpens sp.]